MKYCRRRDTMVPASCVSSMPLLGMGRRFYLVRLKKMREVLTISRLANVAKMGYFRTPDRATEQILKRLAVKEGEQVILGDPCCGEGIALRAAADYFESLGAEVLTYGIEPDEHRAEEAKKRLDYVVKDGYENTSITNSAFSLWWFNPPYDVAAADEGEKAERKEVIFLRDTYKYIIPHGVLVCIVPQHVLKNLAPVLVNRFYGLTVERFDDEDYAAFRQVVVFGYRKPPGAEVGSQEERDALAALAGADLPSLAREREPVKQYLVPKGVVPRTFHGEAIDMAKVRAFLPLSPVRKALASCLTPPSFRAKLGKPLISLKAGQLANIIAAGALDGVIGVGPDRHILVGYTRKRMNVEASTDEEGVVTTVRTTEYVSGARLFTADGRHVDLAGDRAIETEEED